jgi:hypothetical protein
LAPGRGTAAIFAGQAGAYSSAGSRLRAGIGGFAWGGPVPGPVGQPRLAVVHGGERVLTPGQQARGSQTIELHVDGQLLSRATVPYNDGIVRVKLR